jgi:hypothetical protein
MSRCRWPDAHYCNGTQACAQGGATCVRENGHKGPHRCDHCQRLANKKNSRAAAKRLTQGIQKVARKVMATWPKETPPPPRPGSPEATSHFDPLLDRVFSVRRGVGCVETYAIQKNRAGEDALQIAVLRNDLRKSLEARAQVERHLEMKTALTTALMGTIRKLEATPRPAYQKWVTAYGQSMDPQDFCDGHLLNTIRFIERPPLWACRDTSIYPFLLQEARKRGLLKTSDRLQITEAPDA